MGNEIRNLINVIHPCFAASLRRPSAVECPTFTQALTCVLSIVDFTLMAKYESHIDETIEYLKQDRNDFHDNKDVFECVPKR